MPLSDPVRFSNLKHIAKSPLHYHHAVTVGRDDKPWLRRGRGLHAVLFGTPYVVFDGGSRRGKEWERFLELEHVAHGSDHMVCPDDDDCEVILAKELPVYQAQAAAIRAELKRLDLEFLVSAGDIEKRIEWEWLGRKCAGTPDVAHPAYVVDVKTTCSADPRKFHWDARKFCYAEQLAWYEQGLPEAPPRSNYIIAVEKTAPHPVVVWKVTENMHEQAARTLRLWFEQLLACEASNQWPGYVQCVQELDVLESEGLTLTIGEEEVEVE